ncbi:KEOPS complex subunit Pcc1 [Methanobacterium oryzae]|uniref:KEOPS complex subunit Pcc1 n=1 Tax=Methanobacterium oryzae TaxID=69540 RepID=UPI003D2002A1
MEIKSKITFTYKTKDEAEIVLGSLKPDNMDFIVSYVEDDSLICKLESSSLRTTLATIDDILFCEMMTEKIIDLTKRKINE